MAEAIQAQQKIIRDLEERIDRLQTELLDLYGTNTRQNRRIETALGDNIEIRSRLHVGD